MGRQFLKALQALGIRDITICTRSPESLRTIEGLDKITLLSGGYDAIVKTTHAKDLAIIATPIHTLMPAANHLAELGFKKLLIEKPVALCSQAMLNLSEKVDSLGVETFVGLNRACYPVLQDALYLSELDGGITSCFYTFDELISQDWFTYYSKETLNRWGIANSMHLISMVHRLIGMPSRINTHISGSLPWHPTGSVFAGDGVSEKNIPFTYHSDWNSAGRWEIQTHTSQAMYKLGPLENLFKRQFSDEPWKEIKTSPPNDDIKSGIVEQISAILNTDLTDIIRPISLSEATTLTKWAEKIFGYTS